MADIHWLVPVTASTRTIVIFVHGLGGHPLKTWAVRDSDIPWPYWLAEDLPCTAIATAQYANQASRWSGSGLTIREYARQLEPYLTKSLSNNTADIVFSCHSLGGLLVKKLLIEAGDQVANPEDGRSLTQRTKGIMFFATPHGGSSIANIASRFQYLIWPTDTIQYLRSNNDERLEINQRFRDIYDHARMPVLSLYETKRTLVGWVVDKPSSDPGLPRSNPIAISDATHSDIAKPLSRQDERYQHAQMFLTQITGNVETSTVRALYSSANNAFCKEDIPNIEEPSSNVGRRVAVRLVSTALFLWVTVAGTVAVSNQVSPLVNELLQRGFGTYTAIRITLSETKLLNGSQIGVRRLAEIVKAEEVDLGSDPKSVKATLAQLEKRNEDIRRQIQSLGSIQERGEISYRERLNLNFSKGNISDAERMLKALDLRRTILSEIEFRPRNDRLGLLDILNGWDGRTIDDVHIPELSGLPGVVGGVKFHKDGANQLRRAFAEAGPELTRSVVTSWCGSYVARMIRGSDTLVSAHTFGTSFDISCNDLRFREYVNLSERPDLERFIHIFEQNGFLWGGNFRTPDPMHFELFEFR